MTEKQVYEGIIHAVLIDSSGTYHSVLEFRTLTTLPLSLYKKKVRITIEVLE